MTQTVTIFANIKDTSTPFYRSVRKVLSRVKDGASKNRVNAIRKENDKGARNELRKSYPPYASAAPSIRGQTNPYHNTAV